MQITFLKVNNIFISCLLCLALILVSGCGGGGFVLTAEQRAEADRIIEDRGVDRALHMHLGGRRLIENDEKRLAMVKYFVSKGANVNAKGVSGRSALHVEVSGGNLEIVKFLLSKGADVHAIDNVGFTPLHVALIPPNTDIDIVKALVSNGANIRVRARTVAGTTPLEMAEGYNHKEIIEFFSRIR